MLVCSCNRICHRCIEAEVEARLACDPQPRLNPASIYRALGHLPKCCGCFPLAARLIEDKKRSGASPLNVAFVRCEHCCCHGASLVQSMPASEVERQPAQSQEPS